VTANRFEREIIVLECYSTADVETPFSTMAERQASGLIVSAFPVVFNNRDKILALAAK
jgi:hypothetical protein